MNATNSQHIVEQTAAHVKQKLTGEGTGHDWWHIQRVRQMAIRIAKQENADPFRVELAALLHDIADWKFHGGDETAGPREARVWLEKIGVEKAVIDHVCEIIHDLSFKGAGVKTRMRTKEGMVVQDADRLDALGAIGIARAFAYGGHRGQELYNPDILPTLHKSFEEYKNANGTTINHFHEKLLLLKNLMNTATARALAEERHAYMEAFLARFMREWGGKT
ncbi:MAG TPA: HD domain-containing protein [Bacteroidota bacterium]|nr:HD domain-containing protein [Bacteroidota bacterium]